MAAVPVIDDPVEILDACHTRIRAAASLMRKLIRCCGQAGEADRARRTAAQLTAFFEGPARWHQQDEEQDLYPMLLAAAPRMMRPEVEALLCELFAGHRQICAQWRRLRPQVAAIAEGGQVLLDEALMQQLIEVYAAHLQREEAVCFPLMAQLLDPRQLAALGLNMGVRRGVQRDAFMQAPGSGQPLPTTPNSAVTLLGAN